jgi:hypothetical protein
MKADVAVVICTTLPDPIVDPIAYEVPFTGAVTAEPAG